MNTITSGACAQNVEKEFPMRRMILATSILILCSVGTSSATDGYPHLTCWAPDGTKIVDTVVSLPHLSTEWNNTWIWHDYYEEFPAGVSHRHVVTGATCHLDEGVCDHKGCESGN